MLSAGGDCLPNTQDSAKPLGWPRRESDACPALCTRRRSRLAGRSRVMGSFVWGGSGQLSVSLGLDGGDHVRSGSCLRLAGRVASSLPRGGPSCCLPALLMNGTQASRSSRGWPRCLPCGRLHALLLRQHSTSCGSRLSVLWCSGALLFFSGCGHGRVDERVLPRCSCWAWTASMTLVGAAPATAHAVFILTAPKAALLAMWAVSPPT